jgi:hypothetical protein
MSRHSASGQEAAALAASVARSAREEARREVTGLACWLHGLNILRGIARAQMALVPLDPGTPAAAAQLLELARVDAQRRALRIWLGEAMARLEAAQCSG